MRPHSEQVNLSPPPPDRVICRPGPSRSPQRSSMQKPPPVYDADFVFHPELDAAYVHFENSASNPFIANPADLPRVNAWWLAESSLLAYWPPDRATPMFADAGLQSKFVKAGSTDCYVASNAGVVIVAFRGTEP